MTLAYAFETAFTPAAGALTDVMDRMGVRMAFAKDEEIYGQGEDADLIYRVVSGTVRTTRFTNDGRRQIGDFYAPGDLFGLEVGAEHMFCAEAVSDAVILVVKSSALRAAGAPDLERSIFAATARELGRTQDHLLLLGRKTASEKVASFLLELARAAPAGGLVTLPMGRQDMADYLGLTIETVSRMLTQLQVGDIVEFPELRRFRVKSLAALEQLAE